VQEKTSNRVLQQKNIEKRKMPDVSKTLAMKFVTNNHEETEEKEKEIDNMVKNEAVVEQCWSRSLKEM
jgi:hypothetical protein